MSAEPEFVFAPVHATMVWGEHKDLYQEAVTPACDFCLDQRVRWEYPCPDFTLDEIGFGSQGNWLACEACSKLIDLNERPGLLNRSVHSWVLRHESVPQIESIVAIQRGFFDHCQGERVAWQGDDG